MAGQADSHKSMLYALFAVSAKLATENRPWNAVGTISIGVPSTAWLFFEPDVEN